MRRSSSFLRGLAGTLSVFVVLLIGTFGIILVEHYLENFKSH
jgi:hypothetical protein